MVSSPVVVGVVPVVKVDQEAVVYNVSHGRHTHQTRILPVYSLQLHAHLQPAGALGLHTHTHTHDKLRSSHDVYFVASVFEYKLAFVCRQCKAPCDEAGFIMKKVR